MLSILSLSFMIIASRAGSFDGQTSAGTDAGFIQEPLQDVEFFSIIEKPNAHVVGYTFNYSDKNHLDDIEERLRYVSARDVIQGIHLTRRTHMAKKPKLPPAPLDPNWKEPKVHVAPGQNVIKNTFKCSKRTQKCSGTIILGAPEQ